MRLPIGPLVFPLRAAAPLRKPLHGVYTSLVPLQPTHSASLFKHLGGKANAHHWTYMFNEPLLKFDDCKVAVDAWSAGKDPHYYAVLSGAASDPSSEPAGVMSYLSVVPDHRRIEIGCIIFGERLKQTRGTTEASYLLLKHAFEDLGYLRVEWKADALNKPSAIAAERLGFVYEGIFRKHMIVKGRQRDTIWFSMTDTEWPTVKAHLEAWLHAGNFDGSGKQRQGLRDLSAGSKVNPTEETS